MAARSGFWLRGKTTTLSVNVSPSKYCGKVRSEKRRLVSIGLSSGRASGNLALFLPGGAEADVDDQEDADVQAKRHLGGQVGPVILAGHGPLGFNGDRH